MKPTDLRGMLQYVPQFREKTFVVAVDRAAVADENFGGIPGPRYKRRYLPGR